MFYVCAIVGENFARRDAGCVGIPDQLTCGQLSKNSTPGIGDGLSHELLTAPGHPGGRTIHILHVPSPQSDVARPTYSAYWDSHYHVTISSALAFRASWSIGLLRTAGAE